MTQKLYDVQKVYKEDTNLKKEDVDKIFEWLATQPHLPQLTELQVALFLHSCYYKIEDAQKTIENYFTIRSKADIFTSADEELIRRVLSSFFIAFLPRRTPENDAVLLVKLLDHRPEKYVCVEHSKLSFMITSLYFHQFGPANGLIIIYDMEGASFGHLWRLNISAMRHMSFFMQEAAPTRIKGIHHINVNPITSHMIGVVKPFMKKEIYEMIKFHSSTMDPLYEFVPKCCLPEELGGELPPVEILQKKNIENILNHMDFFRWHDEQKVDESKREVDKGGRGFFGFFKK